jgi:polyisoprenyl-phosphate glycosyltransferase
MTIREKLRCTGEIFVLVPVYEDRECLKKILEELQKLELPFLSVIVIDDGSSLSVPQICDLGISGINAELYRLDQNRGQQYALAAGLSHIHAAHPDCAVLVMDVDGQDPVSAIPTLIQEFERGSAEVLIAKRGRRSEGVAFKFSYHLYKAFFWLITGEKMNFGTFMILSNKALDHLVHLRSLKSHLPATVLRSELARSFVSVDREQRYFGHSGMTLLSRFDHAARSIRVFSQAVSLRIGCALVFWGGSLVFGPWQETTSLDGVINATFSEYLTLSAGIILSGLFLLFLLEGIRQKSRKQEVLKNSHLIFVGQNRHDQSSKPKLCCGDK